MEIFICGFFQNNSLAVVLAALPSHGYPCGEGWELVLLLNFVLFSFGEHAGWKSCSVPCAKVPGVLSRAGVAVIEPGLESSGGRWLLISSPSPSWQSGECFPLICQMCPLPLVLLIPLLYISFLSFLHCVKFQNTDLFRAGKKLF